MRRSDLIKRLESRYPDFKRSDIEKAVGTILDSIGAHLAKSQRVELRDFGTFRVKCRVQRTGRNPKTGETIVVSAKNAVSFRTSKSLRTRVDGIAAQQASKTNLESAIELK